MSLTLISLIYFIALSHALLLIAIIIKKSEVGQPGRLLAILIAVLSYKLLEGGIYYSGLYRYVPHLLSLLPGVVLILGPLFYAYVLRMANNSPWSRKLWFMHFLPAIIIFTTHFPSLLHSASDKVAFISEYQKDDSSQLLSWGVITTLLSMKLHFSSYLLLSWRSLNRVEKQSLEQYSDDTAHCILWQKKMCLMLVALEAVWVTQFIIQQTVGVSPLDMVEKIWLLFMAAIILLIGYWGLQHPDVIITHAGQNKNTGTANDMADKTPLDQEHESESNKETATLNVVKYATTSLPESTALELAESIKLLIESNMLYLQPNLKLFELAELVGVRTHIISQVINQTLQTSFFKLVNGYRVKHAIDLMHGDNAHLTLEQVAMESGFNNRVTFNKAFKESENLSPSLYRKNLKMTG